MNQDKVKKLNELLSKIKKRERYKKNNKENR